MLYHHWPLACGIVHYVWRSCAEQEARELQCWFTER